VTVEALNRVDIQEGEMLQGIGTLFGFDYGTTEVSADYSLHEYMSTE